MPRRPVSGPRVGLAASLLLLVAAAPGTVAADADPRWDGTAAAAALHVTVNSQPAAVPVDTLLDLRVPDAASTWRPSGGGTARASLAYPGRTGESGLQLLCDFGMPCPDGFPPDYPLTAHADGTTARDAATPTGAGRAHVGDTEVSSRVTPIAPLSPVLGPLAAAVAPTAASVATHQRIENGDVVVTARSRATDLDLGGGAVSLGLVEAVTEIRRGRQGPPRVTAYLHLADLRTAGGDVRVGDRGVVVVDQATGEDAVAGINEQLAVALAGTPVTLEVLPTTTTTEDGVTTAHVGGLVARLRPELTGPSLGQLPSPYRLYVVDVVVAEADASLRVAAALEPGGLAPTPTPTAPASPSARASTTTPATGTAAGSAGHPSASGGRAPLPAAAPPRAGGPRVAPPASAAAPPPADTSPTDALLAGDALRGATHAYAALGALVALTLLAFRLGARRLTRPRTRT